MKNNYGCDVSLAAREEGGGGPSLDKDKSKNSSRNKLIGKIKEIFLSRFSIRQRCCKMNCRVVFKEELNLEGS